MFWCADNSYTMQLKEKKETHGLICKSIVTHIGSSTLKKLDDPTMKKYTENEVKKFNKIFNQNLFGWGK